MGRAARRGTSSAATRPEELSAKQRGYEPLPGGEWLGAGGCAHLAIAAISLYPHLRIAAGWYSDHGRRALGHAVAYDPHAVAYDPQTGTAYHFVGTDDAEIAVSEYADLGTDMNQEPRELAEHMEIRWNPGDPWVDHGVYEGAEFFQRWFKAEIAAQQAPAQETFAAEMASQETASEETSA